MCSGLDHLRRVPSNVTPEQLEILIKEAKDKGMSAEHIKQLEALKKVQKKELIFSVFSIL